MTATIILGVVLIAGTFCVIFQKQVVDLLLRFCALGKLMDKLNSCFLSRQEKEAVRREEYLRNASPEKLQEEYRAILVAHAGKYPDLAPLSEAQHTGLSAELRDFFAEYDFLNIGGEHILDAKALKGAIIGGKRFIIIGRDARENALFVVAADSENSVSCPVFMIDPELDCAENLDVNTRPENGYGSLRNFVCLMAFYYGEEQ